MNILRLGARSLHCLAARQIHTSCVNLLEKDNFPFRVGPWVLASRLRRISLVTPHEIAVRGLFRLVLLWPPTDKTSLLIVVCEGESEWVNRPYRLPDSPLVTY